MKYALLLIPLLLCACVSSSLAKANEDSVVALGQMAIDKDPTVEPEATAAADNAAAIVEATKPLNQVLHLGVPNDIVDANTKHVDNLAGVVQPDAATKPKIKMGIDNAKKNAADLADKAHQQSSYRAAIPSGIPWIDTAEQILALLGSGVGVVYGATRGQKHVRRWWNTPGTVPAAPPNTDVAATTTPVAPKA